MKALVFINLVMILSSFQLQAQQIFHKNGRTAWNGAIAYYDNGRTAWNGAVAYHDNGKTAWNGAVAYHDNGTTAWNGAVAYHDNGRTAWNGAIAYYDDGKILAQNLYIQIQGVNLNNIELNELEISKKIKLLTKTFDKKVYVVGLKIQLSEKNTILINKENKLTTNIIQLDKEIHFETVNNKVKLSVLGQNVISQK